MVLGGFEVGFDVVDVDGGLDSVLRPPEGGAFGY